MLNLPHMNLLPKYLTKTNFKNLLKYFKNKQDVKATNKATNPANP
jgi:hypothetical protein